MDSTSIVNTIIIFSILISILSMLFLVINMHIKVSALLNKIEVLLESENIYDVKIK